MMHISTITAYDLMDTVRVVAAVRRYDETGSAASGIVFECTTTVPGIGETDPREWLQDALIGLLEAL